MFTGLLGGGFLKGEDWTRPLRKYRIWFNWRKEGAVYIDRTVCPDVQRQRWPGYV